MLEFAGEDASEYCAGNDFADISDEDIQTEQQRITAPLKQADGISPYQMEYKIRRMVNDYLQPPKVSKKMEIGL